MPRFLSFRLRLLLALLLAGAFVTADASASECTVLDRYGFERECTFTEEIGQCGWNAMDSYWQCIRDAEEQAERGSWTFGLLATSCELGLYFDLGMCVLTSPIKTILM